jgi:hypothetical protein
MAGPHFWPAYGRKMLVDLIGDGDERLILRGHPLLCGAEGHTYRSRHGGIAAAVVSGDA